MRITDGVPVVLAILRGLAPKNDPCVPGPPRPAPARPGSASQPCVPPPARPAPPRTGPPERPCYPRPAGRGLRGLGG